MNTVSRVLIPLFGWLALATLAGCGADAPQPVAQAPPTPARVPEKEAPPKLADLGEAPSAPPYSPPYPQRENLFSPPQRQRRVARRTIGTQDEAVALLGFVSVDQPKAVLSIDGVVTALTTGGQKYGIQVISIEPPQVTLQRGRDRWTASLD